MAEKRSMFQKIFGAGKQQQEGFTSFKLLNSWQSTFAPFSGNAWDINAVRAAVDSFARRAARASPKHIITGQDGSVREGSDTNLMRLLQIQPNEFMSAYDMYYKTACQYMIHNNAFLYPAFNPKTGHLDAIYPINANGIELVEYAGEVYYRFQFANGNRYTCPEGDIIHLRRHFNENDMFGSNNNPILPVLETANTFNQSMSKFAKLVSVIRGILKIQGTKKDEDLRFRRDRFVTDNMSTENNGSGVVVTDNKHDYTPITDKQAPIPTGQLHYIKQEIMDYFGTNEKIMQNKATSEEESAYYDGEIDPFFRQLSQAFTACLFSQREMGFGNRITFEGNKMQYATLGDKVSAAKFLTEIGAARLDQVLELFGMPPIGGDEGARRVQTLNMVNAALADKYQVGEDPNRKEDGGNESKTEPPIQDD